MQLGLENKKKTIWAVALAVIALLAVAWEFVPFFTGGSSPSTSAQAAAPLPAYTAPRSSKKTGKKTPRVENLDPTLRLDLLATSEKTQYEGNGRNIFVSHGEDVVIPQPIARGTSDAQGGGYQTPTIAQAPPIPLKFYGFASRAGEPKKIFLKLGEDVFVAGEGEIVDRRYKVVRISPNSVEIQDVVNSGPPQSIPLTQG